MAIVPVCSAQNCVLVHNLGLSIAPCVIAMVQSMPLPLFLHVYWSKVTVVPVVHFVLKDGLIAASLMVNRLYILAVILVLYLMMQDRHFL